MTKQVLFKNFTETDFSWGYHGLLHTFASGSVTPMERVKAEHFTKHLVDRQMTDEGVKTNHSTRYGYESKCIEELEITTN